MLSGHGEVVLAAWRLLSARHPDLGAFFLHENHRTMTILTWGRMRGTMRVFCVFFACFLDLYVWNACFPGFVRVFCVFFALARAQTLIAFLWCCRSTAAAIRVSGHLPTVYGSNNPLFMHQDL